MPASAGRLSFLGKTALFLNIVGTPFSMSIRPRYLYPFVLSWRSQTKVSSDIRSNGTL